MPGPLPVALRERVVESIETDSLTIEEAASRFRIGTATVKRWLRRLRDTGDLAPQEMGGLRVVWVSEDHKQQVVDLVEDMADATLVELADEYNERHGTTVSKSAMARTLVRFNISRKKRLSTRASERVRAFPTRATRSRTSKRS